MTQNLQLQIEKLEREKAELLEALKRLIAKAPDRQAALEDLVRCNYDLQQMKVATLETLQEIRAAIAKAEA